MLASLGPGKNDKGNAPHRESNVREQGKESSDTQKKKLPCFSDKPPLR